MAAVGSGAAQPNECAESIQKIIFASGINWLAAFAAQRSGASAGRVAVFGHFCSL